MTNTLRFLYVKEIDNREYFEISGDGKIMKTDRPLGQVHLEEKARVLIKIDRDLLTKRQVLGMLPSVCDVKKAYCPEVTEYHFTDRSLNVLIEKAQNVSIQELNSLMQSTFRSILEVPEEYFVQKKRKPN